MKLYMYIRMYNLFLMTMNVYMIYIFMYTRIFHCLFMYITYYILLLDYMFWLVKNDMISGHTDPNIKMELHTI